MTGLRELYQEVILDHNKHPRNYGETDGADYQADGYNPLCGDRLVVYLKVHEGKITEVTFVGSGCAISKASASLMTDAVKGLSLTAAKELFDQFVLVKLFTDGGPKYRENQKMEVERFGTSALPFYVGLSPDNEELDRFHGMDPDVGKFIAFLENALDVFKNKGT